MPVKNHPSKPPSLQLPKTDDELTAMGSRWNKIHHPKHAMMRGLLTGKTQLT